MFLKFRSCYRFSSIEGGFLRNILQDYVGKKQLKRVKLKNLAWLCKAQKSVKNIDSTSSTPHKRTKSMYEETELSVMLLI